MGGTKGAKTEPRRLHPLLLRDADGTAIDWNLQARLEVKAEKLHPPLNREGDGGQAAIALFNQYLRRREFKILDGIARRGRTQRRLVNITPTIHSVIATPSKLMPRV